MTLNNFNTIEWINPYKPMYPISNIVLIYLNVIVYPKYNAVALPAANSVVHWIDTVQWGTVSDNRPNIIDKNAVSVKCVREFVQDSWDVNVFTAYASMPRSSFRIPAWSIFHFVEKITNLMIYFPNSMVLLK